MLFRTNISKNHCWEISIENSLFIVLQELIGWKQSYTVLHTIELHFIQLIEYIFHFFIGDYQNALASHKQCVDLVRTQLNDSLQEAREIGNVGAVYLAIGDFDKAVECHTEHLKLAESLNNQVEAARAYSNLGM